MIQVVERDDEGDEERMKRTSCVPCSLFDLFFVFSLSVSLHPLFWTRFFFFIFFFSRFSSPFQPLFDTLFFQLLAKHQRYIPHLHSLSLSLTHHLQRKRKEKKERKKKKGDKTPLFSSFIFIHFILLFFLAL